MNRIPGTELDVFPLNLGGNVFGWKADQDQSEAVLDTFVSGGGNFLDTADSYSAWIPGNAGGESEKIIGEWMRKRRNRSTIVVTTKVSQHPDFRGLSSANVMAAADASLRRLRTDYIDVYQAHFDDPSVPLEETVAAFDLLVQTGKVRYVGLSNYSAARIEDWVQISEREGLARPVVIQPEYSLARRQPYETDLAPLVARLDLAVSPYRSLAAGLLTGKYLDIKDVDSSPRAQQLEGYVSNEDVFRVIDELREIADKHECAIATIALAWLLTRPAIAAPLASAATPEQLPALLAVADVKLTTQDTQKLDDASALIS